MATGVVSAQIADASYDGPTTRYDHGILGDSVEWSTLRLTMADGRRLTASLPETMVFEDIAPRLVDLDGDGAPEVVVIETSLTQGARLAVWDENGRITATPFIGRTHRWLAPIGAADLDGDGHVEIAYIDRPHLAKTLRIWRFANNKLREVISAPGLTNHKIGWDFIPGGIRDCGQGPELITADGAWRQVMRSRLVNGRVESVPLSRFRTPDDLNTALRCTN